MSDTNTILYSSSIAFISCATHAQVYTERKPPGWFITASKNAANTPRRYVSSRPFRQTAGLATGLQCSFWHWKLRIEQTDLNPFVTVPS